LKLIDANILLYAYDRDSALHEAARTWFEESMTQSEPVGFTIATLTAFLRISTSSQILRKPLSLIDSLGIVESWLEHPVGMLVLPTERHWEILRGVVVDAQASGDLIGDGELAASAIEHGATLFTHDRDFKRFEGVRVAFPLRN
jgi:hypothetical protein